MPYLIGLSAIVFIVATIWWSIKNWRKKKKRSIVVLNLVSIGFLLAVSWYAFPIFASKVVYRGLWLNLPTLVPLIITGLIYYYLVYRPIVVKKQKGYALAVTYGFIGLIVGLVGILAIPSIENWQTAEYHTPDQLDDEIAIDPDGVRYTPLQVAYRNMEQTINSSKFTVERNYTDPVMVNGGFAYVSPRTPDGPWQTFAAKVDGMVVYDDSPETLDGERLRTVNQEFQVGEGMEWQDDMMRTLYRADAFCKYPEVFYLQLNPAESEEFTAVAPKIKYRLSFPFSWVPYWGGVSLVDAKGKVTEFTPAEIAADSLLSQQMLFPMELARQMVTTQEYDQGWISGLVNREGKIEVPKLQGDNQMPFLIIAQGGTPYAMVSTEPAGQSSALFRQYYVNLTNGDFSYYEYDPGNGVLGPRAAIDIVKSSIVGMVWIESSTSEGFQVIEPRPLPLSSGLYWHTTITNQNYASVTKTAVVNASTKEVFEFDTRQEFMGWINNPISRSRSIEVANISSDLLQDSLSSALSETDVAMINARLDSIVTMLDSRSEKMDLVYRIIIESFGTPEQRSEIR